MKKFTLFVFAIMLILGFTGSAFAEHSHGRNSAPDRVGKWDLGLGIAAAVNDEADDSSFLYGQISYGVTPYIGLGVEAGWQEADTDRANEETIGAVPVLFDIIVRVPTVHEAIVPYGVLGLGAAGIYSNNENGSGANNGNDVDDTGFAWKLGGGIDWFINSNWIFNFEFAYWSADVSLPRTSVEDEYSWWTAGIALKYVF